MNVLFNAIKGEGFCELSITTKHAAFISELHHYHSDPFDRILIAHALSEPLRFLTLDK